MTASADRHLLFGLLALQNGLIDQGQLMLAFQAWTRDKAKTLGEHLEARGDLSGAKRALLEALAEVHLEAHGGDVEKSLAAVPANRSTRASLAELGEPEIEATLARVTRSKSGQAAEIDGDDDPDRTACVSLGAATSDGQRFRVLRPHARGGLGEVFVALDAELHREVAVKHILEQHADDPASRQRFVAEAEITGGLEHPGVVPVYGLGTYDGGRPYYAMRFIRGDSLKEAIQRFHADPSIKSDSGLRSLELRKLLRRFLDVCNATDYAHSRGVIHRDLKPANVILGKHGETLVVDWGLAKAIGRADPSVGEQTIAPSSSGSSETLPGSALGTPAYMSPEQARGDLDRLSPRSDVYSLGATLYCLLTGRPPFEGDDVGELLHQVQKGDFVPPRQLQPSLDAALESVCKKAMANHAEDRYASCRALADDVERWIADEPVSAYREPLATRVTRWGRRHRTAAVSAGVLLLTAVVGLSVGALLINRERSKAETNFRQARAAVDRYFTTVSESKLLDVPGLQPLRQELLDAASEYYRDFLQKRGNDPSVRADAAAASYRVGWMNRALGRTRTALVNLQTSAALYEKLVRDQPGIVEYHRLQAICLGSLALVLHSLERNDEALLAHRQALAIREDLVKIEPGNILLQNDLSRTHRNIGDVYRLVGKADLANAEWDQALAIGQPLLRSLPAGGDGRVDITGRSNPSVIVREDVGRLQLDRTNYLRDQGRQDEAWAALRQARDLFDELSREQPDDLSLRADQALVRSNEGILLADLGRPAEAEKAYRASLDLFGRLAAANPTVHQYRSAVVDVNLKLGVTLELLGRLPESEAAQRKAIEVSEGLLAEEPDSPYFQTLLVKGLNGNGSLLMKQGRAADALPILRRAVEVQETVVHKFPETIWYQGALINALRALGAVETASGHVAEARDALERAAKIDLSLADAYPVSRYNVACDLALMVPISPTDRREAVAKQAIDTIRQATAAGYADIANIEKDTDLNALRLRGDFQALMAELRAKAAADR
jgi:serine/threonine-protein kinase